MILRKIELWGKKLWPIHERKTDWNLRGDERHAVFRKVRPFQLFRLGSSDLGLEKARRNGGWHKPMWALQGGGNVTCCRGDLSVAENRRTTNHDWTDIESAIFGAAERLHQAEVCWVRCKNYQQIARIQSPAKGRGRWAKGVRGKRPPVLGPNLIRWFG